MTVTTTTNYRPDALARRCLTCGAEPGAPCHTVLDATRLTRYPHSARYGTRSEAQARGDASVGRRRNLLGTGGAT